MSEKIDFNSPPLIEVVCGVQFGMLEKFTVGHVGKLWSLYEPDFQESREQPALLSMIETFPDEMIDRKIVQTLMPRTILAALDKSAVIQVQRDAFYYNWQKASESDPYPRYEEVMKKFEKAFSTFTGFLTNSGIGDLVPLQYELTYLNEIPIPEKGRILKDSDWDSKDRFLSPPESIDLNATFLLEKDIFGRLHTNFRSTIVEGKPVYHWSLVVRGCTNPRSEMNIAQLQGWFNCARRYINNAFVDLSDSEFQKSQWGRKS